MIPRKRRQASFLISAYEYGMIRRILLEIFLIFSVVFFTLYVTIGNVYENPGTVPSSVVLIVYVLFNFLFFNIGFMSGRTVKLRVIEDQLKNSQIIAFTTRTAPGLVVFCLSLLLTVIAFYIYGKGLYMVRAYMATAADMTVVVLGAFVISSLFAIVASCNVGWKSVVGASEYGVKV